MPTSKNKKTKGKRYAGKINPPNKANSVKKRKDTTPAYMKFFYGFMLVVLLMGSFARIARNQQTATPAPSTPTSVPVSAPTPIPAVDYPAGEPDQVVRDFLSALEKDPSGQSELSYLSLELQNAVSDGSDVQDLLGLTTTFTSFDTEVIDTGQTGEAIIKATLNLASPYEITFNLSNETGTWHISRIQPQNTPVDHSGG